MAKPLFHIDVKLSDLRGGTRSIVGGMDAYLREAVEVSGEGTARYMRGLFKFSTQVSPVGRGPYGHVTPGLKETTLAVFNSKAIESIAGPLKIRTRPQTINYPSGITTVLTHSQSVPDLLNRGGRAILKIRFHDSGSDRTMVLQYRPRNFVGRTLTFTVPFIAAVLSTTSFRARTLTAPRT